MKPTLGVLDNEIVAFPIEVKVLSTKLEAVTAQPKVPKTKAEPKTLAEKEQRLAALAQDTRRRLKRSTLDIYYIGLNLLEAQNITEHGEFLPWLRREFGMGKTSAYEFIHVASAFESKLPIIGNLLNAIIPTALYKLAAPSTPEAARAEAIERVQAGEVVGPDVAREIINRHKLPKTPKTQRPSDDPVTQQRVAMFPRNSVSTTNQLLELVAISPTAQVQAPTADFARVEATRVIVPQPSQPAFAADVPGVWWRLSGRHLLYCGHPNSEEFLTQITEKVQLLLAFPPAKVWHSRIKAEVRLILTDYLPIFHKPKLLDEVLGTAILSNSSVGDFVVNCFVPSPDILAIINRLERRGVFAEQSPERCKAVVDNWKRAGLLVEKLS